MAKATKEEQIQKIKDWVRKNANRLFLAGMALLLAARLFLFWMESNYVVPESEKAQPILITKIESKITEGSASFNNVMKMITEMPDFTTSTYKNLAQFNMFDPGLVKNADAMIARSNTFVSQAQDAFKAGRIPEAKRLLEQAFAVNPSQATAHKLKGDIDAFVAAQIAATSGTATNSATSATTTQ